MVVKGPSAAQVIPATAATDGPSERLITPSEGTEAISETFVSHTGPVGVRAFGDANARELGEGVFAGININDLRRRQRGQSTMRGVPVDLIKGDVLIDERFIPISISDLIYLLAMRIEEEGEQAKFIRFCRHLCYHVHVALYDEFLIVQNAYQSQDPDRDTERIFDYHGMEDMLDKRFNNAFETMRNSANFTVLAESQAGTDEGLDLLKDAMEQKSKDGLNIKFDSKPFNIKIYSRGQRMMKRHKDRDIFNFEFFAKDWEVVCYRRLVVSFELMEDSCSDESIQPRCVYMKMFKDFPHDDVSPDSFHFQPSLFGSFPLSSPLFPLQMDMLMPAVKVKMSWRALALVMYPFILGLAIFISQVVTWSGSAEKSLVGFGVIFFGLLMKGYKSVRAWLRTQKNYRASLVRSLYYNQLDVNKGVLTQLHNEAERQIMREAVLAYAFLWMELKDPDHFVRRTTSVNKHELDKEIEAWLKDTLSIDTLDFEISDALHIVKEQGAVEEMADGTLKARDIDQCLTDLGKKWDTYF
eukprot:g1036.t1